MKLYIESLRRLYATKRILKDKIIDLFIKKRITESEKDYILQE